MTVLTYSEKYKIADMFIEYYRGYVERKNLLDDIDIEDILRSLHKKANNIFELHKEEKREITWLEEMESSTIIQILMENDAVDIKY